MKIFKEIMDDEFTVNKPSINIDKTWCVVIDYNKYNDYTWNLTKK